jgi:hypothetical protein
MDRQPVGMDIAWKDRDEFALPNPKKWNSP